MGKKLLDVIPKKLQQRLATTQQLAWRACANQNPELTQVVLNSQALKPGGLFIALPGRQTDGRTFIQDAIKKGAAFVLAEAVDRHNLPLNESLAQVQTLFWVDALDQWIDQIAQGYYGDPSTQLSLVGVTGTNGKTSVTYLLAQVLGRVKAGLLGTLGIGVWDKLEPTLNTTADVFSVYAQLNKLVSKGIKTACMEVSSHAIDQGRVRGLSFYAALFTNLSHDHLDYHGDLESYGRVKRSLFEAYPVHHGVFNLSDPFVRGTCERLLESDDPGCRPSQLWGYHFGPDPNPLLPVDRQVWLESVIAQAPASMHLGIRIQSRSVELRVPWVGQFHIENLLALITLLVTLDCAEADYLSRVETLIGPPGRMQQLKEPGRPSVIIDYAHTPAALKKVLQSIRSLCQGTLWCVFGCGGNRDVEKRPIMGQVAAEHADRVLVTSDNPRCEAPHRIIDDILSGIPASDREHVQVEVDREQAICLVLKQAAEQDWILIAGKGHESYQEIYGRRYAYRDQRVVETLWFSLTNVS